MPLFIKNIRFLFVWLVLFCCSNSAFGRSDQTKLSDLQNVIITSIISDDEGYIWISTTNGLFRYDGTELTKYLKDSSQYSIGDNLTFHLFPDDQGNIYATNLFGYSKYNKQTGKFINVYGKLEYQNILKRKEDGSFIAFTGTNELSLVNGSMDKIIKTITLKDIETDIENKIYNIDNNLFCLWEKNSFILINNDLEIIAEKTFPDIINSVLFVNDRIILGTQNGIITLSLSGNNVSSNPVIEEFCKSKAINILALNSNNEIIVGVIGSGIYKYQYYSDQINLIYEFQKEDGNSADFRFKYIDKYNRLWLQRGLKNYIGYLLIETDELYPEFSDVTEYLHQKGFKSIIHSIVLDKSDRLFIYSEERLYIYNPKSKNLSADSISNFDGIFINMFVDTSNRLWILTSSSLSVYNITFDEIDFLQKINIESSPFSNLLELQNGTIIMNNSLDIIVVSKNLDQVHSYSKASMPYILNTVPFVNKNGDELIFKKSDNPLVFFNSATGFYEPKDLDLNSYNTRILLEENGNTWYTTDEGVYVEKSNGEKLKLEEKSGLYDKHIFTSAEDTFGNVWILTTSGLVKYISSTGKFINYNDINGKLDHLGSNSMIKTKSGEIYLYGNSHLLKVNAHITSFISAPSSPPAPIVSSVLANSTDYFGSPKTLELEPDQNQLTISFSSLDFIRPEMIDYEYKMNGHDNTWRSVRNYNKAIYSNLQSGTYDFMIRAKYDGYDDYTETVSLPIKIKYNYWQHPAFITILIILMLSIAFGTIRSFFKIKISRTKYRLKSENEELKANLFTNLSHTFRTPVSLIFAPFQELIAHHTWDEQDSKLIETIDKNLKRIIQLSGQFLEFNDNLDVLQNQDYKLQVDEKDIVPIIREIASVFRSSSIKKGISISIDMPESFILPFDEDKLVKILYNLVTNAVKFTPQGGKIKITAKKQGKYLIVSIADTGIGINDEIKNKIFDRYFLWKKKDISNLISRSYGIGLSHTKQLVSQHHGEIMITDNKPKGTVFSFSLPISLDSYKTDDIVIDEDQESQKILMKTYDEYNKVDQIKRLNILIVEDNEELLSYLQSMLLSDYNVLTAKDGFEAIDLVSKEMIDIIMTDVMMPRMNGFELCRWIKENSEYCHLPVIILTAKSSKADQLEGIGMGADAYLTKPFDPEYLQAIIHNILENRNKIQALLQRGDKLPSLSESNEIQVHINDMDAKFIEKLNKIMAENITNSELNINSICREIGFSRTNFFKKVNALTGMTPNDYISNHRLNKAIKMLQQGENSMTIISESIGFSSSSAFSRKFKSKFGNSPTEYLKNMKGKG